MRVVFVLRHEQGKIYTTILGGYWEIPAKQLSDNKATLTEKHKTVLMTPKEQARCIGLEVSEDDFASVKTLLHEALPKNYELMLQKTHSSPLSM